MKTSALARLPAVVSLGAPTTSCQWSAELAREAGATEEEIVGVLWAVGPIVGLARVVAAAPALALAIGYDVEAGLRSPANRAERGAREIGERGAEAPSPRRGVGADRARIRAAGLLDHREPSSARAVQHRRGCEHDRRSGSSPAASAPIGALLSIGGNNPRWSLGVFFLCAWIVYGIVVYGEEDRSTVKDDRGAV